jgi:hypothetical protein
MSENIETIVETETVEETVVETTLEDIVAEIANTVFGTDSTISPYKIAKIINTVFQSTMTEKQIPAQMMYQYASKGMISKGNKSKEYTKDEVTTYVLKYTSKHVEI